MMSIGFKSKVASLFCMNFRASGSRVLVVAGFFSVLFLIIAGRLISFALVPNIAAMLSSRSGEANPVTARPSIVDRNGFVLATDIKAPSVFAEPRNILDPDEATELLTSVLPDLNASELRDRLSTRRGFIWIKRHITPRQQRAIHRLGIPGVGFVYENKRVYPNGALASHVLGFVNVDNVGISGLERYLDASGLTHASENSFDKPILPLALSIDLRVQNVLRQILVEGLDTYRALAAGGLILDVNTGEVLALVSLPDFNPNSPELAMDATRINHLAVGVYEMGSTFKALTTAMALDSEAITIHSRIDARGELAMGRFRIHDYHGKNRVLSVPEVFIYSSNIGTARMALTLGRERHKAFLKKMGQLDRLYTELPENAAPLLPRNWVDLSTATIAFGHGIAVTPLQATASVAALVNGGIWITPTFLKRPPDWKKEGLERVIKSETSEALRYIMRLNAEMGSARKANIEGYFVGGKTGTSEKVVGGRYVKKGKNFTTFMAIAPADRPRYLFLVLYDEPQPTPESHGHSTAAWNAGVTTGQVLERVMPLLGVEPYFSSPSQPFPTMAKAKAWGLH
jgi:cell division protein FtsI (penicillin-binding protein 3)